MVAIRHHGRVYAAKQTPSGRIIVTADNGARVAIKEDELHAYLWLGDHGLKGRIIRRLLDAEIRQSGPFADRRPPAPSRMTPTHELDYDARMKRRAERRASPEYQERLEAIKRRQRHREIWRAIREHDKNPPRVRGCGAAAKRAGFAS